MCVAFTVRSNHRALPFRSPVVCLRRQENKGEKGAMLKAGGVIFTEL